MSMIGIVFVWLYADDPGDEFPNTIIRIAPADAGLFTQTAPLTPEFVLQRTFFFFINACELMF